MQMNRRNFLQLSAGMCFASALAPMPLSGAAKALANEARKEMKVVPFTLKIGATKPFTAIHISDTHITLADEREVERKRELAANRHKYFGKAEANFYAALDYAREKDALLLHTGDLIDFLSEKNLEFVANAFTGSPETFVSSGNHEFSHYLGEAKEDEAYKQGSYARVQKAYPNDLTFCSKIVNGVNFVAFDDVYYYVAEDLIDRFKGEIDKGLPIVTLCHVPFYTPGLFKFMIEDCHESSAYVTGAPEEEMKNYSRGVFETQRADEKTLKFIAWLKEQSLVKALLTGHEHVNYVDQFSESAKQYVVGGNFKGDVYEFSFE